MTKGLHGSYVLVFSLVSSLGNAFAEALTRPPLPVLKGQGSWEDRSATY